MNIETERKIKNQISNRQFQRMMMIELFSTTSLILPALVVRLSGKNGMVTLLYSSAFFIFAAMYYLWICEDWEFSYDREMMRQKGKVRNTIYAILYGIRFFLHAYFLMVLFSALLQEVLLPYQSRGVILFPVLVLSFYATRKSLKARARTLELLFPYIFIPLLFVLVFALFQVDYTMLPPMLWSKTDENVSTVLAAYAIFMVYCAMEFILFLYPVTEQKDGRKKSGTGKVCMVVIFLNLFIYVITVGMFGTIRTGKKLWSALLIMQNVRLPGHFLERLDILFLAFWIFSVFALFSGYLFYSERIVKQWEQTYSSKKGVTRSYPLFFLIGIFCLVICQPDPEKLLPLFARYMMWIDFPLSILLPVFLKWNKQSFSKAEFQKRNVLKKKPERRHFSKSEMKKVRKTVGMLVFFICCTVLFTGCDSRIDIEDRNYILTLGFDKGRNQELLITYGEADFDMPSGQGEGGDEQRARTVFYEADSLLKAEEADRKSDEKRLDYGHLKAILFSEELFSDKEAWNKVRQELENKTQMAGTVLVFLVAKSAKKCMESEQNLNCSLGDYLDKMMTNHKQDGKRAYTLGELLRDEAERGTSRRIPVLKMENEKIVLLP